MSTDTQSTNGTGKSSLVEVIHFCFGAELTKLTTLRKAPLQSWEFFLEFAAGQREFAIRRSIKHHRRVLVRGVSEAERSQLPSLRQDPGDVNVIDISVDDWNTYLGELFYDADRKRENTPTFRQLFRYFCRYGQMAFIKPETTFPREADVVSAKCWSYLLNLNWKLLDQREQVERRIEAHDKDRHGFKSIAGQHGLEGRTDSSIFSALFAAKTLAERDLGEMDRNLSEYRVLPEYEAQQKDANDLTVDAQELRKQIFGKTNLLQDYEKSLGAVVDMDPDEVVALYQSAEVELPGLVVKRLQDVQEFHRQLLQDRREELAGLIAKLNEQVASLQARLKEIDDKRSALLRKLENTHAQAEVRELQERVAQRRAEVIELQRLGEMYDRITTESQSIEVSKADLQRAFSQDEIDFREHRKSLITRVAELSSQLYNIEALLLIQVVTPAKSLPKYTFEVQITHKGATGYERSEVLLFDLLAAQEWGPRNPRVQLLVHDSLMFDPMDPRQIAHAIELARTQCDSFHYQYLVLLNESQVPHEDLGRFKNGIDFEGVHQPFYLSDTEDGGLFGFQFEDYESSREPALDFEGENPTPISLIEEQMPT
jgi:uncharacterized protein YydD (DUF2326 family)